MTNKKLYRLISSFPAWLDFFLFSFLVTLILPLIKTPVNKFFSVYFLLSVVVSFLFWRTIGLFNGSLGNRKSIKIIFSLVLSFVFSTWLFSTVLLYIFFQSFITGDMLKFVMDDPQYVLNYVKTYFLNIYGLLYLSTIVFSFYIWYKKTDHTRRKLATKEYLQIVFSIVIFIIALSSFSSQRFLMSDVSFFMGVKDYYKIKNSPGLTSSKRFSVAGNKNSPKYNVLFVLNESMGKHGLIHYGYNSKATPFLNSWFKKEKNNFVAFNNFQTNSNATDVSVPSMFTGVAVYESYKKLHKMPFLWNYMNAAGYKTIFVTAQRFNWGHFDKFFFSQAPDYYDHALTMGIPIVHDLGVDDLLAVTYLQKYIEKIPPSKSFFAIYNSNALHEPYQQESGQLETQPNFSDRYDNALFLIDKTFEKIYNMLKDNNRLENTIIVFTGDHGDYSSRDIPRLYSFYEEIATIPFVIRFPDSWIKEHPQLFKNIKSNKNSLSESIDIVPTFIALNNLEKNNKNLIKKLQGTSLTIPAPKRKKDYTISSNVNSVRRASSEAFAIYFKDKKSLVFSTVRGINFFDQKDDPHQEKNIWSQAKPSDVQRVNEVIEKTPLLQGIMERYRIKKVTEKDK